MVCVVGRMRDLILQLSKSSIYSTKPLRAKESQRALIDAAAEILHKSRTDFILEMACKAAENVILDRRVFNFNDEQYAEFIDMLDAPVEDDSAINKLLARKPQWDV
ncbi:hypothetical protein SM87_05839 [Klebsiella pneumoniae]|nr:hypothetical protein SM87_05839 [Klebsiella pneumoniae]